MLAGCYRYHAVHRDFTDRGRTSLENLRVTCSDWVIGYHKIDIELLEALKQHYNKKVLYLIRDPRDCLTSLYFYRSHCKTKVVDKVRFRIKTALSMQNFVRETLEAWKNHVVTYKDLCDLTVSYEQLRADCAACLLRLTGLEDSSHVESVVEKNSFQVRTGRLAGQENKHAFVRKGIIGDWVNHYSSPEYKTIIKQIVGQELIQFGYEENLDW